VRGRAYRDFHFASLAEFQQEIGMKSKAILVVLLSLACAVAASAQERGEGGQGRGRGRGLTKPPATDKVTPEIPGVVKAGTKIEIVNTALACGDGGMGLADGSILASCRPTVTKIAPDGSTTVMVENSDQAAGLAVDSKGRIIGAQYTKKVSVLYPKGSEEVLTDSFDGKPYIRPNDLVADKKGGIYFTDCYQVGVTPKPDDPPQSVYYIAPNSKKVIRVASDVRRPNGITLSADDKTLYVNDWDGEYVVTFNVQPDGTLNNRKNFGKYTLKEETDHGLVSGADGLCIDSKGNTFATTPAGVQVFGPKGEHLGDIEAPYDQPPQNCGFGGPDYSYLYVTGRGVVYRIRTLNAGVIGRGK
jgi:gluconolactonase